MLPSNLYDVAATPAVAILPEGCAKSHNNTCRANPAAQEREAAAGRDEAERQGIQEMKDISWLSFYLLNQICLVANAMLRSRHIRFRFLFKV